MKNLLVLLLLALSAGANSYKEVARFDEGVVIRIEYRSDGDRRGLMVFEKGGLLLFKPAQWKTVQSSLLQALAGAPQLAVGGQGPAVSIESASGSSLRIQALRPTRLPAVALAVTPKGGSVVLDARHFTRLRAALAEVDAALP